MAVDDHVIRLPNGKLHDLSDPWCLGCEALDSKWWRFTRDQAARVDWLLCADCQLLFRDLL
jgi:hypothetical protein